MVKKIIVGVSVLLLSVIAFGKTTWKLNGALDGDAGLMIVYKTIPPLMVDVEDPDLMVVSKSRGSFTYSEVAKSKQPLKGRIEINYDKDVASQGNNGLNKNIIRTIYNSVNISFLDNGVFALRKDTTGIEPKKGERRLDLENQIDGEVFFTSSKGLTRNSDKRQKLKLEDTVQNGVLRTADVYIDARFNKGGKELMAGKYRGVTTLVVEFVGQNLTEGGN